MGGVRNTVGSDIFDPDRPHTLRPQACVNEVKIFCREIPDGEARVIRCLQDNKYDKDFGKDCKEKVRGSGLRAAINERGRVSWGCSSN